MEEKETIDLLFEILFCVIREDENTQHIKERLTPQILPALYHLAKKHGLSHILSFFVFRNQVETGAELGEKLKKAELLSVYRCEQMRYAFEKVCCYLEEAEVAYIPLKGSVIRPYYPNESMRTSCDIDILIHERDVDRAVGKLVEKGCIYQKKNYHDVSLHTPNGVHLELHFSLKEKVDALDGVLKNAWEYAAPVEGYRFAFTDSFFVFHMFAHMAYHFEYGGCGIRSLLDIWIMTHKMGLSYGCAKELLQKAGILRFAEQMHRLSEHCAGDGDGDAFLELVIQYILAGGIYGSAENQFAMSKTKSNSTAVYAIQRLFLPYQYMIQPYPILKKVPYLLPLFWIVRWISAVIKGKSGKIVSELSSVNRVDSQRIAEIKKIRSQLGI